MRFGVNTHTQHKRKIRTVTQIAHNQYLVEGEIDVARFGCVVDPIINYVDIDGGPYLEVGKDFFGKGRITQIQNIDTDKEGYLIIKVTIHEKT